MRDWNGSGSQWTPGRRVEPSGIRSYEWYRSGLERSRSVARIETSRNYGTGFLIEGSDIVPKWPRIPLLVTNSHVTLGEEVGNIKVSFQALEGTFEVAECVWSLPPAVLDVAIYRLEDFPEQLPCCPVSPSLPSTYSNDNVYLIGHPDAGSLGFSLYNNALIHADEWLLHYSAPTKPGSSGSPVFDDQWNVIGVHQGSGQGFLPDGTPYEANKGITMRAIMEQATMEPKPK
jgi:hypothetical protein